MESVVSSDSNRDGQEREDGEWSEDDADRADDSQYTRVPDPGIDVPLYEV